MDSVDCSFSFSRSRTPSPRNSFLLAGVALLLALGSVPAHAQPAPGRKPAHADSLPHRAKPFTVMLRSAAVPGWGQAYNHKYLKAGIVIAGEGLLAYQAVQELKRENRAIDRQDLILAGGGDITDPAYVEAQLDQETHRNKKINWIWWGIAAHLLSMMDAYVDAHLASFDADFGPPQSAVDGAKPRLTLAFRARF
jgi:uncharacterized protein DUF5683